MGRPVARRMLILAWRLGLMVMVAHPLSDLQRRRFRRLLQPPLMMQISTRTFIEQECKGQKLICCFVQWPQFPRHRDLLRLPRRQGRRRRKQLIAR